MFASEVVFHALHHFFVVRFVVRRLKMSVSQHLFLQSGLEGRHTLGSNVLSLAGTCLTLTINELPVGEGEFYPK